MKLPRTTILFPLCLLLAGCGGPIASDPGPAPAGPAPGVRDTSGGEALKTSNLQPGPGRPFPAPLDSGRVELSAPAGWDWFPRDSAYITRLFKTSQGALPRILVTAVDAPTGLPADITPENVEQLREYIAGELVVEDIKPLEPPKAIQIDGKALVRYVRGGKLKNASVERQVLLVLRGGRLYTIELQSFPADTEAERDAAYAVAGSMKFSKE